ncbi:hypothetical protein BDV36DRAFT_218892 [Aspergillus pseudocaelatus]|uniref:Uncharacterized protein n=1 Tax=Aspergillus pseudocaelatus TaxID=1825620 RepID=A0ABQ6WFB2_9EURO|nr:hypothetical protein BDV36DRAFT_218892 [Aspergillus pseudocaelatus]
MQLNEAASWGIIITLQYYYPHPWIEMSGNGGPRNKRPIQSAVVYSWVSCKIAMVVVIMGNNNLMDRQKGDTPMQGILWVLHRLHRYQPPNRLS